MVLPAGKVFDDLDDTLNDPILVHGIMDGYFITENDEVILFDYKTDHIYGRWARKDAQSISTDHLS